MKKWKAIEGYEEEYQVSNFGKVRSLGRYQKNHSKLQWREGSLKSFRADPQGYLMTDLYKDGKQTTQRVHRLVAEAFIENPNDEPTVNHIDGDRNNNAASNLEWMCFSEQNKHFYKMGLKSQKNIKKAVKAMNKATAVGVKCVTTGKVYSSQAEAGRDVNISSSLISLACNGKRRTAGSLEDGTPLEWVRL